MYVETKYFLFLEIADPLKNYHGKTLYVGKFRK